NRFARVDTQVLRQVRAADDLRGGQGEEVANLPGPEQASQVRMLTRELLQDRKLSLAPRDHHGADLEDLEAGLRGKAEPAVTCRSRVGRRFAALEGGPDVAEVAHRGTDGARVALDDDHAEAAGAGLNRVR